MYAAKQQRAKLLRKKEVSPESLARCLQRHLEQTFTQQHTVWKLCELLHGRLVLCTRALFLMLVQEDSFNAEIVRQIKERKLAAQRKRAIKSTYR